MRLTQSDMKMMQRSANMRTCAPHLRCCPTAPFAIGRRHVSTVIQRFPAPLQSAVTNSLISVLKDELKYERSDYRKDEILLDDPPGDFQIDSPPGKNSFFLLKASQSMSAWLTKQALIDGSPPIPTAHAPYAFTHMPMASPCQADYRWPFCLLPSYAHASLLTESQPPTLPLPRHALFPPAGCLPT